MLEGLVRRGKAFGSVTSAVSLSSATVRQILAHVRWLATLPAIALARSPPVEVNVKKLIGPEAVEAIPELEFDQMVNLVGED